MRYIILKNVKISYYLSIILANQNIGNFHHFFLNLLCFSMYICCKALVRNCIFLIFFALKLCILQQLINIRMNKKTQKKKTIAEYDVYMDRKLGGGAFGSVYEGFNHNTKEKVAVKMIPKDNMYNDNEVYLMNAFKRQSLILSKISSENVVGFKDIIATKRYFYIFQQLCDGDLRSFINTHKAQPQKKAIEMMTQLLRGFYALIVTNVIHRDIKPQNILFKNKQLKLADFGLSKRVGGDQLMTSYVGTKMYSSPQIITKTKYTTKCDIWSLGLVFYELLYGKKLLSVPQAKLLQKMKEIDQILQFPVQPEVSQQSKEIIRKCLKYNEDERANWAYLFSHPLFRDHTPSLEKLNIGLNYIISSIRQQIDSKYADLQKYFKRLGLDKSKQIGFDEYIRIVLRIVTYGIVDPQQIRFSFNYFDKEKNGKISFDQFYDTLKTFGAQKNVASRDQIISNIMKQIEKPQEQQTIDESFHSNPGYTLSSKSISG